MARRDPNFPRYSADRPLYGAFRKNHLVCFLQLVKAGTAKYPGAQEIIAAAREVAVEEFASTSSTTASRWTPGRTRLSGPTSTPSRRSWRRATFFAAFAFAEDEMSFFQRLSAGSLRLQATPKQSLEEL
eukprot:5497332-Alexandrium_andersonii.AAC.1